MGQTFYIDGVWIEVKDLKIGDLMFNGDEEVEIRYVECSEGDV